MIATRIVRRAIGLVLLAPLASWGISTASAQATKRDDAKTQAKAKDAPKTKAATRTPIDLNSATADELAELPGIGPVLAKAIVAGRPYKTVDDLKNVKGIGDAKFATLSKLVKVTPPDKASAPPAKSATTKRATTKDDGPPAASKPAAKDDIAKKSTKGSSKPALKPGQKIDINTASKTELEALPGIGPVKAQAIIDKRPFKTIDDIKDVKGIGDVTFDKIKDSITVK